MSERRRLPAPGLPALPPRPDVEFVLPGEATLTVSYSRQDIVTVQHSSISPELQAARMHEAQARKEEARYEHAVPAEQRTLQVRTIGYVAVATVLVGVIGIVARPEAATQIAAMVGVLATIFGGLYVVERRRRAAAPKRPPTFSA